MSAAILPIERRHSLSNGQQIYSGERQPRLEDQGRWYGAAQTSLKPVSLSRRIQVKPGDSWALIGTKGSGKTTGLKYLDAAYTRLFPAMRHYVLDSKHDGDFDDWPGRIVSDQAPGLPSANDRYQVWAPIRIIPDEVERWLEMVLNDPPALLEIDELVHLVYKRNSYSDTYNIIQKTGRSLPIATITLTQELSRIPPNAYKQSTHVLGFYIREAAEYDRRILNLLLGGKVENPHHPYGLYYQHERGRGEPEYHASIQKFLSL